MIRNKYNLLKGGSYEELIILSVAADENTIFHQVTGRGKSTLGLCGVPCNLLQISRLQSAGPLRDFIGYVVFSPTLPNF